jgi:ferredoxin
MRVILDRDLCQGHGVCCEEAPEVFKLDSKGDLEVLQERPSEEQRKVLELAVKYCPTRALRLED